MNAEQHSKVVLSVLAYYRFKKKIITPERPIIAINCVRFITDATYNLYISLICDMYTAKQIRE